MYVLDRDIHVANYTAKAVTVAATNKSKFGTVTTAGGNSSRPQPTALFPAACYADPVLKPLHLFFPVFIPR